jgi:hypothetical protein
VRGECAGLWRWYLHGNLVGFKFHERFARSDGVANLFEPAGDSCFNDRFAERRDLE